MAPSASGLPADAIAFTDSIESIRLRLVPLLLDWNSSPFAYWRTSDSTATFTPTSFAELLLAFFSSSGCC